MKVPGRLAIAACLICNLFIASSSISSFAQQSEAIPAPQGKFGVIASYHPACSEKNSEPDCRPRPVPISSPPATYSEQARKAKIEGICTIQFVVDEKGNTTNIRVINSLGMGLDEKAVEAVKGWKFTPGFGKDGKPVAVRIAAEIPFHL